MSNETTTSLLFGPSLRGSYWTMLGLTLLCAAIGWVLIVATDIGRAPGGEAVVGPVLVVQVASGMILIGLSIGGCAKLTWQEILLGLVGGIAALLSAWLLNEWPALVG